MRALLLFALLTTGCASQALLASEYATLKTEVEAAHARTACDPLSLAVADSELTFAELELQQGSTRRASEHIAASRAAAAKTSACAAPAPRPVERGPTPQPAAAAAVAAVAPAAVATDTDRDGVSDEDDRCPMDPEDLDGFKDSDGCPELDNDMDGVSDIFDRCGADAEDRDGFQDEDGCPDLDNDMDGVADAQDKCPTERGAPADGGCPVYDRDNDGVGDSFDRCAEEPETKNGYLDEDGCADTKPQRVEITADQIVIKQRINFATGKATILPDSFPVLDDVATALKDYPQLRVEIGGHTDNVGDDTGNQRLSKSRADAVFEYLLSKGVAAPRMFTVGYGETRPIDTNMTDTGRNNNRRVEFVIINNIDRPQAPPAGAPPVAPAPNPWGP